MAENVEDPVEELPPAARVLFKEFRGRAEKLRLWAAVFLVFAILALFLGLAGVIYVRELILRDVTAVNDKLKENKKNKISEIEKNIKSKEENLIKEIKETLVGGGRLWFFQDSGTELNPEFNYQVQL